jgi:hypothetical protein
METNIRCNFYSCHVERSRDISNSFAFEVSDSSTQPALSEVEGFAMTD